MMLTMAERKRFVVKSTKKSAISKVEVITVESNDMPSLTARHPVGVVVAEKRIPSHVSHSEHQPRPVFLPGCPLPQILPPESQATNQATQKKDLAAKVSRRIHYRPEYYKLDEKLRKPPKTVTFRIDESGKEGKVYNPKDYINQSQGLGCLRKVDTSIVDGMTCSKEKRSSETFHTGPPRYVLVSEGVKRENYLDSGDNGNDNSTADSFPAQNSSENLSTHSSSEEFDGNERKEISSLSGFDSVHGFKDYTSSFMTRDIEMNSSDTLNSNDENSRIHSETTSVDENQEISTSESMMNDPPSDGTSQVIPVKRGSLRVRQSSHITETLKGIENQHSKLQNTSSSAHPGGIRSTVTVHEKNIGRQGVTSSGDYLPRSRAAIYHGTSDSSCVGASNIRMGTKECSRHSRNRKIPWRRCPSCPLRPDPDQKAGKPRQISRAEGKVQATKPLKHSCSFATATTSAKPSPRSLPLKASSPRASSLSPPRIPVNVSASSPPKAMTISPPTSLSPTSPADQPPVLPSGDEGGEASKIRETSEGTNSTYLAPRADPAEGISVPGMSMEELENVPKWLAGVRDELKGLSDQLDAPPSRLSSIIQGLSSGTFDEEKYIISRRVDHFISKACRNAATEHNEGKGASPPPILPMTSCYPLWPPDPITSVRPSSSDQDLRPRHPPSHPSAHPLPHSTTYPSAYRPTNPLPQASTQQLIHPPPLFMHSQIKREPSSPLGPLQNCVRKSGRRDKNHRKVRTTNCKREESPSHKSKVKDDSPEHSCPDTSEKNKADNLVAASELPSLVVKTEKTVEDPKLKLQISTQASVHIPRENITETLPGISISPREPLPKHSQKHKIVEVVHESSIAEESSLSSKGGKTENNLSDDETCRSDEGVGEKVPGTTVGRNDYMADVEEPPSPSCDAGLAAEINMDGKGNGHSQSQNDSYEQEPAHGAVASDDRGESEEENYKKIHNDKQHKAEERETVEPNIVYLIDYNNKKGESVRHQDPASKHVEEDSENAEREESLPGYMPQMRWEEVAVENYRYEDTVEYTREMLQEAEERLHQHDLRLRILKRLEERLRELVQVEQTPTIVDSENQGDFWTEDAQEDDQNTSGDDQDVQKVMAAVRAILGSLVCERLDAALTQVSDEPKAPTNVSGGASPSFHIQSRYESSFSSDVESSSSTQQELEPESNIPQQDRTPSPSPPPEKVESTGRLLTPQISVEEDEENRQEVIATPPSSPPPSSVAVDMEKPLTPSETPPSSPIKLKKTATPEYTPTESPLHSGRTVVHVDTPVQSPLPQHVPEEVLDIPKTPTPSVLSPVHPESVLMPLPVLPDITTLSQDSKERSSPKLQDQAIQADIPDRMLGYREDMGTQVNHEDGRDIFTPETPSVICQSSSDVTVSSSVEGHDITCYTVSEGEVINGAVSTNLSLEAGEVASAGCLHLLTCNKIKTTALINRDIFTKMPCTQHHESLHQRSEGETELDESSEGLLIMEDQSSAEEHETSEETQLDGCQRNHTVSTPVEGLQVSVVHNSSYSSGDATTLSSDEWTKLRQENAKLLSRLGNFGSFSFLSQNPKSFSSSSSK
ncbi:uncharacterized protein [Panulirus ornatus]|uniref:uncharacterized protein n=1 Tax=Panulirus ornatus TaxID=150431 RepID=UPI003A845312